MTSFMENLSNAFTAKGRAVEIPHTAITEEVSTSIMSKNPGKVPVVVIRQDDRIQLKKSKFLVPCDLTMGQLVYVLRRHSDEVKSSEALFVFISKKSVLAPTSSTLGALYEMYKEDGFLKIELHLENTFGAN